MIQTLHIGAENGKGGLGNPFLQFRLSEIKFMISQDHGIELHGIHQFNDRFALREIGPVVSLNHIAGGQQKSRLFRPQVLCLAGKMGNASQELAGPERLIGFGETMKIIDMKNPQIE
jgi:hypothetical protein